MEAPLRLLVVGPAGTNRASGLFYSVPRLTAALAGVGAEVALLTTSSSGPYVEDQPYPVFYYKDLAKSHPLECVSSLFAKPDLIVFHSTYIPIQARIANQARKVGIPYVITPRGGMTRHAQHTKRVKKLLGNFIFFKRMVGGAAAIHCLTEQEAVDARKWGRSVFVVGNGIDPPLLDSPNSEKPRRTRRIVFLGRLDIYHKGLDLLIEASRLARDDLRKSNAAIDIYGPDQNDSRAELQRLIVGHRVDDIVSVRDPVYENEKHKILQSADLFLHTSRFEGHPIAVLEALSYGIPCLLTPGTNMSSEVAAAVAGWECDSSPAGIAAALRTFLITPDNILCEMSTQARLLTLTRYSWESVAKQLVAQLELITSQRLHRKQGVSGGQ